MDNKFVKIDDIPDWEDYVAGVYENILIHSLIFMTDFKEFLADMEFDTEIFSIILQYLKNYLDYYQDKNIFDDVIKNNIYTLTEYADNLDTITDNNIKNSLINEIKLMLNNTNNENNNNYLARQIILRDYGIFNNKLNNKIKVNKLLQENDINKLKEKYYHSISDDFGVIHLLTTDDDNFDESYEGCILVSNFYRSINYFSVQFSRLFNDKNFLERIKFIMKKNDEFIKKGNFDNAYIDEQFYDLDRISKRVVKQFDRSFR